jgi:hypothetical protein
MAYGVQPPGPPAAGGAMVYSSKDFLNWTKVSEPKSRRFVCSTKR